MVFFTLSTLTLGLAALTSALPSRTRDTTQRSNFSLALNAVNYLHLSLNAIQSSTIGIMDLIFERQCTYPGTPAYLNNTLLIFTPSVYGYPLGTPYSMSFPSVGDNYGYTVPVTAIFGENGNTGFGESNGVITAKLDATLESFFACNETLDGVDRFALKWGVFKADGGAPDGCVAAQLVESFNVQ
ncbi:hypothetical protein G7Y89_g910 [Cudoniella acicularis]|uniref:Uncharacterized protein n=1 Tax=Cudoniella acicularis TaxID=354080 RepID=A0A8H4RWB3_9HELO|nr:hypothetical protein G7Y89_g910 [Cudoniella acicularis]